MLKRLFLAMLLFAAAGRAAATDYTDIWWLPAENGWGVNVVQSDNFLFLTFFIYGADGKPTWYSGHATLDGSGNYNGTLNATTGTYYIAPWMPASLTNVIVGTVSFQPIDPANAKLVYVVNGVGTVTKVITRQTLTPITIGGFYSGAQTGSYSSCTSPAYRDFFDLDVTQPGDGTVTFVFSYTEDLTCTFSGTLVPQGQLYSVPVASYTCSDGLKTGATMTEIKATAQGIEGVFVAPTVGGGCRENAQFSGVLR
jgi:hypothetical protein